MLRKPFVKWVLILLSIPILLFALLWGGLQYATHRNEQELETVMETVEIPEEWELVEEGHGGALMCLDICQYYTKTYAVGGAIDNKDADELAKIIKTVDLKINETENTCREGSEPNKSYCVATMETSTYRVSGSTSRNEEEQLLVSIGIFKR